MNINTTKKLNNGVEMPMLGLGVWRAEGDDAANATAWALEAGYRMVDTAALYQNEAEVGRAVRQSGLPRDEVFVTTKLWNAQQDGGRQRAAFEDSLNKLGLEYVDLYLLHWPVPGKFIESWKVLEQIYDEGLARAIGVSNFQPHHLDELMAQTKVTPALNQVELHPYFNQEPVVRYCQEKGIAVEGWRSLGGGKSDLLSHSTIAAIGKKYGKSNAQVIVRWVLQRDIIVIPKSVKRERIVQNADVFDFELSTEDMTAMNALHKGQRYGDDPDDLAAYPKMVDKKP